MGGRPHRKEWVRSRVGTPPPPSDLQLLQEYYAHDAWQLLVACVLMSRVSHRSHARNNGRTERSVFCKKKEFELACDAWRGAGVEKGSGVGGEKHKKTKVTRAL